MPTDPKPFVVVFSTTPRAPSSLLPWRAARTVRALRQQLLDHVYVPSPAALAEYLQSADKPVWLVREGEVPADGRHSPKLPPASATGKSLLGFGSPKDDAAWEALLAKTGGQLLLSRDRLPPVPSLVVEHPKRFAAALARVADLRTDEDPIARACHDLGAHVRAVHLPRFDVDAAPGMHVVEVVTTLHRGGAERLVLDLSRELGRLGIDITLAVLDHASRSTFEAPPGTLYLDTLAEGRADRLRALGALAVRTGADVIHAHLLNGDDLKILAASGVPVVMSIHNSEPGWPVRFELLSPGDLALVIACSRDVERQLEARRLPATLRTIWNGIQPRRALPRRAPHPAEGPLRLLSVANHRPQKRLERLPTIIAELRRRGRDASVTIVGEPVKNDPIMAAIGETVREEARRLDIADHVTLVPAGGDIEAVYDAHDVVVSTSAFEGLSLVHLEALAAGRPLVATAVAGTEEIAAKHPHAHVVPLDASPSTFGAAIARALEQTGEHGLALDFTTPKMAERHAELFARVLTTPRASTPREGIVLVANNFSTGGAQSSARRLLLALRLAGVPVRACVIQEQVDHPTPGRARLQAAGVEVFVAPRAGDADPLLTARAVVHAITAWAPAAVVFWNVIPQHKLLMADLLFDLPLWDVSPGEMYFASFARYFEKPRVGLPYLSLQDFGKRLAGVIVKYEGERPEAAALGAPVHVVPNGVNVPPEAPPARPPRAKTVVGTLSRLCVDKKLEQLVDAVAHACAKGLFHDCELRIAGPIETGDEAYVADLQARARELELPILWVGEQDSATFLADLDLFAMVSEPGGCPNASLEAMAAGLAVVATDVGGAREQIIDGQTGLLVPRGDEKALGEAIASLAKDPTRRVAMGRAGHARVRAEFDVRRMARDYARLFLGTVPASLEGDAPPVSSHRFDAPPASSQRPPPLSSSPRPPASSQRPPASSQRPPASSQRPPPVPTSASKLPPSTPSLPPSPASTPSLPPSPPAPAPVMATPPTMPAAIEPMMPTPAALAALVAAVALEPQTDLSPISRALLEPDSGPSHSPSASVATDASVPPEPPAPLPVDPAPISSAMLAPDSSPSPSSSPLRAAENEPLSSSSLLVGAEVPSPLDSPPAASPLFDPAEVPSPLDSPLASSPLLAPADPAPPSSPATEEEKASEPAPAPAAASTHPAESPVAVDDRNAEPAPAEPSTTEPAPTSSPKPTEP